MTHSRWFVALLCSVLLSTPVAAQNGEDTARRARDAYQSLDYPVAAALFRRALAASGEDALPDSLRPQVYTYLGATELFRARRQAADSAFLNALAEDPRHRPNAMIFPPEVTDVFQTVRRGSRYVKAIPPHDTTIVVGDPAYLISLYASARHEIDVDLLHEDGRFARSLYSGTIGDSMIVRWDGRTDGGREPADERLMVQITSARGTGGGRIVRLPLTVRAIREDTLLPPPPPADSQLLRERSAPDPAMRALAVGVVGGLAAIALPALAAESPNGPERFILGATLGLSGVIGFIAQRPGRQLSGNVAANREEREAWERAVEEIHEQNVSRRQVRLRISAGAPRVIDEETP